MNRASAMYAASMLTRYRVNSPVKSGAIRSACTAKIASTTIRSTGIGGLDADRMRRVWVERLDRDRHLLGRCAKCDRSETFGDRSRFVERCWMIGASQGCENAGVIGQRDGTLVVEAQRCEGLHSIEDQLLGLRELT